MERLSWPPPSKALHCAISSSPTIPVCNGAAKSRSHGSSPPCPTLICRIPTTQFGIVLAPTRASSGTASALQVRTPSTSQAEGSPPNQTTPASTSAFKLVRVQLETNKTQDPSCCRVVHFSWPFSPTSRTKPLHPDPPQGWSCLSSADWFAAQSMFRCLARPIFLVTVGQTCLLAGVHCHKFKYISIYI